MEAAVKTLTADEMAQDLSGWIARVVEGQAPIQVSAPDGSQVVLIPASWWIPAGEPLPEAPGQDEWS